jgi:glucose-1-phosphate cytidylyltransferase
MKVVILAGGIGSRLSEETSLKPKPMVEIGNMPIIWHIMKIYSYYGYNDFIICLGYKGYMLKEYFYNYFLHKSDVTINLKKNKVDFHKSESEQWKITLIDTGLQTMTGGRIKRIKDYVEGKSFMLTYGDGVSDIDINALHDNHIKSKKLCTVTAVPPPGRFGALNINSKGLVKSFEEKTEGKNSLINGGFFICENNVFDYIKDDDTIFEKEPLENISKDGQLNSYRHIGFWRPMDTLRDKNQLSELWTQNKAPWKLWS